MPTTPTSEQTNSGVINALASYFMWGLAPMYFKALTVVGATEILIHRVVWSTLLLLLIVVAIRKWQPFVSAITNKKLVASLALTATLLGSNWYIFIWAVNNDHLLDASLGYYINPIFNVALGDDFSRVNACVNGKAVSSSTRHCRRTHSSRCTWHNSGDFFSTCCHLWHLWISA